MATARKGGGDREMLEAKLGGGSLACFLFLEYPTTAVCYQRKGYPVPLAPSAHSTSGSNLHSSRLSARLVRRFKHKTLEEP
jgi:hypothetical protein